MPMVITPVVVAIVFRLIYASDAGMLTAFSEALGGGPVADPRRPGSRAFIGLVALDVWEWTPLMFLILLAGLQSLPVEPFEAARVDGAGPWRVFVDHTLPMLRPVLAIAIVLRTIDAFGTFDQVFVLTRGGPGEATRLLSIYGYDTAFKFQQTGYAAALFVTMGLLVLALALAAVRMLRRAGAGMMSKRTRARVAHGDRSAGHRAAADLLDGCDLAEVQQGDHPGRHALSACADASTITCICSRRSSSATISPTRWW